jgi:hypothetical protein
MRYKVGTKVCFLEKIDENQYNLETGIVQQCIIDTDSKIKLNGFNDGFKEVVRYIISNAHDEDEEGIEEKYIVCEIPIEMGLKRETELKATDLEEEIEAITLKKEMEFIVEIRTLLEKEKGND